MEPDLKIVKLNLPNFDSGTTVSNIIDGCSDLTSVESSGNVINITSELVLQQAMDSGTSCKIKQICDIVVSSLWPTESTSWPNTIIRLELSSNTFFASIDIKIKKWNSATQGFCEWMLTSSNGYCIKFLPNVLEVKKLRSGKKIRPDLDLLTIIFALKSMNIPHKNYSEDSDLKGSNLLFFKVEDNF